MSLFIPQYEVKQIYYFLVYHLTISFNDGFKYSYMNI
jgi:hypothetical protein